MTKKILYVRSGPYKVNLSGYNLQELGLGKAFCNLGYDVDILYYSDKNDVQLIKTSRNTLRILWTKGIRLLRSGVYPSILKKEFLNQYDYVFISEYSQVMAVLLNRLHDNVYVYNGPYYNLFKLKFIEPLYDKLFVKFLNKRSKKIFCKTAMAESYLKNKGFTNTKTVGTGIDLDNYRNTHSIDGTTQKLLNKMRGNKNILYVGSIIPRKNVELIVKSFVNYREKNSDNKSKLIIIGKGSKKYTAYCKSLIPKELESSVLWVEYLNNSQLKYVYDEADIFMLPSKQEIFGMVLLEAMYFGKPVIASLSAGSDTLIEDGYNGYIINNENIDNWSKKIEELLENDNLRENIGEKAHNTIIEKFTWDKIVLKMEKEFRE
ncbi:glycosyltransferase family 4 protein [Ligilactobacillus salivarius]|uniref:glycosyltransferase family 4 protein n=1 Tax=Ligilactobacillus salivarius TaxID=1624 RepID=UPI001F5B632F|nr:glycosyltransferase family 4 protein [Ligilactobacillus salivarius]